MKKLSIITINYNNAEGLEKTIRSVSAQSFRDFEHILIDGGSNDGSVDIIKKISANFSYWISEKDKGIYNAMNKGIQKAQFEYILFLNSGDVFADPDTLAEAFKIPFDEDIVYGDVFYSGKILNGPKRYDKELSFGYMFHDGLPHQATFIRRTLFDRLGLYDESLLISSDWKFFLQAIFMLKATSRYIPLTIAVYDSNGASSDEGNYVAIREERMAILKELFPGFVKEYEELFQLRSKYSLMANSRYIQYMLKIKSLATLSFLKRK